MDLTQQQNEKFLWREINRNALQVIKKKRRDKFILIRFWHFIEQMRCIQTRSNFLSSQTQLQGLTETRITNNIQRNRLIQTRHMHELNKSRFGLDFDWNRAAQGKRVTWIFLLAVTAMSVRFGDWSFYKRSQTKTWLAEKIQTRPGRPKTEPNGSDAVVATGDGLCRWTATNGGVEKGSDENGSAPLPERMLDENGLWEVRASPVSLMQVGSK